MHGHHSHARLHESQGSSLGPWPVRHSHQRLEDQWVIGDRRPHPLLDQPVGHGPSDLVHDGDQSCLSIARSDLQTRRVPLGCGCERSARIEGADQVFEGDRHGRDGTGRAKMAAFGEGICHRLKRIAGFADKPQA